MNPPDHSHRDLFADRRCVIATMHGKEQVIGPLLETELGMRPEVFADLNTDEFGTFTREVDRPADQITTARLKIQAALDRSGATLGVASEGSFGPHPVSPLIPCNREIVFLLDLDHDLEIWGESLSTHTNFAHDSVQTLRQALEFGRKVGFPNHGLILRGQSSASDPDRLHKGITTEETLTQAFKTLLEDSDIKAIQIETDMRAMVNPTRMQVIAEASQDLIRKLQHQCPRCGFPGFSVAQVRKGLPCDLCGLPTSAPRAYLYRCDRCQYEQEEAFPLGVKTADPGICLYCNP